MDDRYKKIDAPCSACGMVGIWICSARDCPMRADQKGVRDEWLRRQEDPPEPEPGVQKQN